MHFEAVLESMQGGTGEGVLHFVTNGLEMSAYVSGSVLAVLKTHDVGCLDLWWVKQLTAGNLGKALNIQSQHIYNIHSCNVASDLYKNLNESLFKDDKYGVKLCFIQFLYQIIVLVTNDHTRCK